MSKTWLLLPISLIAASCAIFPAGSIFNPGSTTLDPKVLAVTEQTTETTKESVGLRWNDVLNSKSYEIIKKNQEGQSKVFPTDKREFTDSDVKGGKSYTYSVRALDGNNTQLTISKEVSVTPLVSTVKRPVLPGTPKQVDVAQPDLTWDPAEGAKWYFIKVNDRADGKLVFGGFSDKTSIKVGAQNYSKTVSLPMFDELHNVSLKRGSSYEWTVTAIRAEGDKL
ncbi:MAG TPA: hypothetical protein DD435_05630, partial [Cyanobacteria bacterium UBA8530]|nr:hypothetical protein [Cyanobacteria bacterium UBA8530]